MNIEQIKEEANRLSIDDLYSLSDFCLALGDALEKEQEGK